MTQTLTAGQGTTPLADFLIDLAPSAGAFPLALIEALIDRMALLALPVETAK